MSYPCYSCDCSRCSDDDDPDFFCSPCQRYFASDRDLKKHLSQSSRHNYCLSCDRDFVDPNALRNHLASRLHSPPTFRCRRCNSGFVSASALTKHIELGRCYGFTNQEIASRVRQWEQSTGNPNLLTVPRIGWQEDCSGHNQIRNIATEASFDGSYYVCPVCRRGFGRLSSLNQHLSSNVHDSCEFRCRKCLKQFRELSALVGHVESGSCGAMSRGEVKRVIDSFSCMRIGF